MFQGEPINKQNGSIDQWKFLKFCTKPTISRSWIYSFEALISKFAAWCRSRSKERQMWSMTIIIIIIIACQIIETIPKTTTTTTTTLQDAQQSSWFSSPMKGPSNWRRENVQHELVRPLSTRVSISPSIRIIQVAIAIYMRPACWNWLKFKFKAENKNQMQQPTHSYRSKKIIQIHKLTYKYN